MKKVIIVGGGFAGVKCAKILGASKQVEVTLFNPVNHMVFTPLLADVAGSSLNPRSITAPLRQMLKNVHCRSEKIVDVNTAGKRVNYQRFDGSIGAAGYDELVISVGNRVDLGRVPGMVSNALPLKSIGDAIAMRQRVMERLEQADASEDEDQRRWLTSFVVIGGGFSGVEVAGEINDLAQHALKYYRNIPPEDINVTLVHSRDQILPEVTSRLRDFAIERMKRHGVNFILNARASVVTRKGVDLGSGDCVEAGTVVCTVGNTATELVQRIGVATERGRIITDPDMQVADHDGLWAVGDCALVPNAHDGEKAPPTAQFAERQGGQAARNILRKAAGKTTKPFSFKPVGLAAGIGGRKGVAELMGVRVSGFMAFWLWRSAFLVKLPSVLQKIKVGVDWAWELVFPREISAFSSAETQPVSRSFFAKGETLFDNHSAGRTLYALEGGDAEIVELATQAHGERVLAVVGPGELIGGHTLNSFGGGNVALKARTNIEAISLAGDFLQRMSDTLKPVESMLRRAMLTHKPFWDSAPGALSALRKITPESVMKALPRQAFQPATTVLQAFARLRDSEQDLALVMDGDTLVGLVTRTDLISGLEGGQTATVGEVMSKNPAVASLNESCDIAANTIRDRGFKWLPVVDNRTDRQVVGMLYADDLLAQVLGNMKTAPPDPI
ncbi:MAG: FAD-dependent oxidoreductase [Lysobacterales bacterium]